MLTAARIFLALMLLVAMIAQPSNLATRSDRQDMAAMLAKCGRDPAPRWWESLSWIIAVVSILAAFCWSVWGL